jgi:hypothetical protein
MSSWFSFCKSYVVRNLSFSFWFSSLLEYRFSKYSHMIFWICFAVCWNISFSSLILLIWIFPCLLLGGLAKGLLIFFYLFSNKLLFISMIHYILLWTSISLILGQGFIISFYLLLFELVYSCFCKSMQCIIRLNYLKCIIYSLLFLIIYLLSALF